MGQRKSRAVSATFQGSACRLTTWPLKGVVGTLGTYQAGVSGQRESWPANYRHDLSTENACRSPTLLIEANAVRKTVFNDRIFNSAGCNWFKGRYLQCREHQRQVPRSRRVRTRRIQPQMYPGWGSDVEHRDSTREALRLPEVESV